MIQYPPNPGHGKMFFTVASSPLAAGQSLETCFAETYQAIDPQIKDASQQTYRSGTLSGLEKSYNRPWGEPWWQFRDVWLEKNGVIYILSCQTTPGSMTERSSTFDQILDSFQFKQ